MVVALRLVPHAMPLSPHKPYCCYCITLVPWHCCVVSFSLDFSIILPVSLDGIFSSLSFSTLELIIYVRIYPPPLPPSSHSRPPLSTYHSTPHPNLLTTSYIMTDTTHLSSTLVCLLSLFDLKSYFFSSLFVFDYIYPT